MNELDIRNWLDDDEQLEEGLVEEVLLSGETVRAIVYREDEKNNSIRGPNNQGANRIYRAEISSYIINSDNTTTDRVVKYLPKDGGPDTVTFKGDNGATITRKVNRIEYKNAEKSFVLHLE
jgi:hypothetical protein